MKHIKLFENFNEESIHDICERYGIENYTINEDRTINVNGEINFYDQDLEEIPLKFRNVTDNFDCSYNKLTSLENCPKSIYGGFSCYDNQLISLKFMPFVNGNFHCGENNIRDFVGFIEPGGDFYCQNNPINEIWKLFLDKSHIELLNDYDCIRDEGIIIDRLNEFLEEIDKPTVKSVNGYNNI